MNIDIDLVARNKVPNELGDRVHLQSLRELSSAKSASVSPEANIGRRHEVTSAEFWDKVYDNRSIGGRIVQVQVSASERVHIRKGEFPSDHIVSCPVGKHRPGARVCGTCSRQKSQVQTVVSDDRRSIYAGETFNSVGLCGGGKGPDGRQQGFCLVALSRGKGEAPNEGHREGERELHRDGLYLQREENKEVRVSLEAELDEERNTLREGIGS